MNKDIVNFHGDSLQYMSAFIMNQTYRELHCDSLQQMSAVVRNKDIVSFN